MNELAEADAGRRLSSVIARYSKAEGEERKATTVVTNSPFARGTRSSATGSTFCVTLIKTASCRYQTTAGGGSGPKP
ncbi:hypothetical protein [Streptomyces sp. NPDC060002]|uniref:hypothetical protein n=1 Tax=Streptomyces sp. NPDC060002 TaxID=3347033 RepID=UPI0036C11960